MKKLMMALPLAIVAMFVVGASYAQTLLGTVKDQEGNPIAGATVRILKSHLATSAGDDGRFRLSPLSEGNWTLRVQALGFIPKEQTFHMQNGTVSIEVNLEPDASSLDEVVVSGTMKEVSKLKSPIPVEVYTAKFFKANPAPSVFESLQTINGVRPQINCAVCNTGDIHINGLEGPYTMVLIDGMPIVSGLSTVYGLTGIPQFLVERMEVVKGPASTLYGSEAVGGLINVITKNPGAASRFNVEAFGTDWREFNLDMGGKFSLGSGESLIGLSYFNYSNPIDKDGDRFTDLTLQDRLSLFNKWNILRDDGKLFSFAGRYVYEDRWGGEMSWNRSFRGGEDVYGESIYTKRWELMGVYDLPGAEHFSLTFSVNGHDQNSMYGSTAYHAVQKIAFGQLTWRKQMGKHDLLAGLAHRYTYYDDNTPATSQVSHTHLPGLFLQSEWNLAERQTMLMGLRYDYNSMHGNIFSPRLSYKWNSSDQHTVVRLGIGNGYRVANVFTEDHAALTGSREVVFVEDLKPETSWNGNLNVVRKFALGGGAVLELDASAFYTYFDNKIIPDYETNVQQIIYSNLDGHAVSQGLSLSVNYADLRGIKASVGGTLLDVYSEENGLRERPMLTERFMGTWNLGFPVRSAGLTLDYTGNLVGPMRLPVLGENDPRPAESKTWHLHNIQVTRKFGVRTEVFAGVKNLFNWTPSKDVPFLIARTEDPFDKQVEFDAANNPMVTPNNPYGLTFDPSYMYAPNQGIRGFLGVRYQIF